MHNFKMKSCAFFMAFVVAFASTPTIAQPKMPATEFEVETSIQEIETENVTETQVENETEKINDDLINETERETTEAVSTEETTGELTTEVSTEESNEENTEETTEENSEEITEETTEESTEETAEESTEETTEESTEETTEETNEETTEELELKIDTEADKSVVKASGERAAAKDLNWLITYYKSIHPNTDNSAITDSQILVTDYLELIMLSQVDPAYYYNKDIVLNTSNNTNTFGANTFNLSSEATVKYENQTYSFLGLCADESYAYEGTLSVGEMTLMTDTPLFVYLSDKAECTDNLVFSHKYNTTNNLLAENVVHSNAVSTASQWNITLYTASLEGNDDKQYQLGSMVGTMKENAKLAISFTNAAGNGETETAGLTFASDAEGGIFAERMEKGSKLTVSYSESNACSVIGRADTGSLVGHIAESGTLTIKGSFPFSGAVSAESGDVGGLVGSMEKGSSIELKQSLVFQRNVSTNGGNAGGLVGSMNGGSIPLEDGMSLSVSNNLIRGTGHIGGLFGYYAASSAISFDNKYSVNGVTLSGGRNAGGLFGVLRNVKTDAMSSGIEITISNPMVSVTYTGGGANFGGLAGAYKADHLSAKLRICKSASAAAFTVSSTLKDNNAAYYGGLIGQVANQIDGDTIGYSYLEIEDVAIEQNRYSGVNSGIGGVIGETTEGHLVNLGSIKVTSKSLNGGNSGGIIGKMKDNAVLRLSGTTDLSAVYEMSESASTGQLVGSRDAALIYAAGSGNDNAGGDGWRFIRMEQRRAVSDIGNYGEVLRLNGTKLKEKKLGQADTISGSFGNEEIIRFSPYTHQVMMYKPTSTNLGTSREFAALASYIQKEGKMGGCFLWSNEADLIYMDSNSIKGDIALTSDIDMTGTGIFGLMRSNDNSRIYAGTFDGGNHSLTLTAGELYGFIGTNASVNLSTVSEEEYRQKVKEHSEEYKGCGENYVQPYLGLFARIGDGTIIRNISMLGYLHFDACEVVVYAGVIAGEIVGNYGKTVQIANVTVHTKIVYGSKQYWAATLYASAYIGYVNGSSTLNFENCTWSGKIYNYKIVNSETYDAGFIGYINRGWNEPVTINVNGGMASGCEIEETYASSWACYGTIVAQTSNLGQGSMTSQLNLNGFILNYVKITSCATERAAGLLSYGLYCTNVDMTGVVVNSCELSCGDDAVFGGLVNSATGYWNIHKENETDPSGFGIKFDGNNRFTGASSQTTDSNNKTSGLLIANGQDKDRNMAVYLEVRKNAYLIVSNTVNVSIGSNYFDEFVGSTINKNSTGNNGIVSIATDGGNGINEEFTYKNQTGSWQNNATRYYYNLDKVRFEDETNIRNLANTMDSGEDLLCWSVVQFAASNIDSYFNSGNGTSKTIKGTIDLTGLSFYPAEKNCYLTFEDSTVIIFGYKEIYEKNSDDDSIKLNDENGQHYLMHYGLYSQISADNSSISVEVTNLTLKGTVGFDSKYCGALICDNVTGRYDSNNSSIRNTTLKITNLSLDGIKLYGFSNNTYAPLLIHSIGEYTTLTVKGVKTTEEYTTNRSSTPKVATSLIGKVGGKAARVVSLSFLELSLDGRSAAGDFAEYYGTCNSIFTRAILLESLQYVSGSGQYNFASTEGPYITYGQEISNTEGGNVSGRNNGLQYQYYDGGNVLNPWTTVQEPDMAERFASGFLRYVCGTESGTSHELDINLKVDFFEVGCGTYSDPYIVTDGMQLERLAAYINDGTKLNGMKLQVDSEIFANQSGTKTDHTAVGENYYYDKHVMYTVEGENWCTADAGGVKTNASEDLIRDYVCNAYYMIANNITLGNSGNYYGIGNATVADNVKNGNVFSGVIVGKKNSSGVCPVITIKAPKNPGTTFAGLVSCANGCVIKDLVLDYKRTRIFINGSDSCNTNELGKASFFGGVIGRVIGGDNIIDNVAVNYADNSVSVTETTDSSNYATLTAIGGYVGMVGWDYRGGGGVIFRNMPKLNSASENSYLSMATIADTEVYVTAEYHDKNYFYYANPYVGRVTDAYVCYEKTNSGSNVLDALENTNKNYRIPTLTASDKLSGVHWVSETLNQNLRRISVDVQSAQDLWMLSAIVNSGAAAMTCNSKDGYYGPSFGDIKGNAYNYGKVRYATYDQVGKTGSAALEEEAWWSRKNQKDTNKVSYLVKAYSGTDDSSTNYGKFPAAHLTGEKVRVTISISSDCDMTDYGNGFRGIGSSYNRHNRSVGDYRIIAFENFTANGNTITLNMSSHEYVEEADESDENTLSCRSSALFPFARLLTESSDAGRQKAAPRVLENVVISGTVKKDFYRLSSKKAEEAAPTSSEAIFTGGFIGSLRNTGKESSYLTFSNIDMKDIVIQGGYDSAGIIGYIHKEGSKNIQFVNCDMSNVKIQAVVCTGGYIGAYNKGNNNKTVVVNTDFDGNVLGEAKASFADCSYTGALRKNDSCIGSLIGYIGDSEIPFYIANIAITDAQFGISYNEGKTNYTGGLAGINKSGICVAQNVEINGCSFSGTNKCTFGGLFGLVGNSCSFTIQECNVTGSLDHRVQFESALHIGGIIGNTNSSGKTKRIINCTVKGTAEQGVIFKNADCIGGIIGTVSISNNPLNVENCTIGNSVANNVVMENGYDMGGVIGKSDSSSSVVVNGCTIKCVTGASSRNGSNLGGVAGELSGNNAWFTVRGTKLDSVILLSSKMVGGLFGYNNPYASLTLGAMDCSIKNSKIVTAYDNRYDRNSSGAAGVILGYGSGKVKGFNILSYNNLCGFQLKNGVPDNSSAQDYQKLVISEQITQKTYDTEVTLAKAMDLSAENVGLKDYETYSYANGAIKQDSAYQGTSISHIVVFIPYADLEKTGMAPVNVEQPFRYLKGTIGCWIGNVLNNENQVELIGVSKQGTYLPNTDIGYRETGIGSIIYGDYKYSASGEKQTDYPGNYPYITTSPLSDVLVNIGTNADGTEKFDVTGDAASFDTGTKPMLKKILSDYKQNAQTKWNKVYNGVDKTIYESFDADGVYTDKLSDYLEAEAFESEKANCETFPLLVVDTLDADVITEMINNYVSIVTNSTQTKAAHSYSNIEITSYRWDQDHFSSYYTTANGSISRIEPSLKWIGGTISQVRPVIGKYDNSLSQFTMVDVQFALPINNDTSIYHVYIPVLVKKVLLFNMYIAAENGSDYAIEQYDDLHSTVIASHGENVTLRLTYQYLRTKEEWENSINGGENYLWKFDKTISIGGTYSTSLPDGTWMALVDVQSGGLMYDRTIGEEYRLNQNVLSFSKAFPAWQESSIYFSEVLPLRAESTDSGEMVETTADDKNATIYFDGKYYRPYDEIKDEEKVRYHIICTKENETSGEFKDYVPVEENYFLTICTPKNAKALLSANTDFVSVKGSIPTRKSNVGVTKNGGTENNLVIGNFFVQTQIDVKTSSSTDGLLSDEMATITGTMEVTIDFTGDTEEEKAKNRKMFLDNSSAIATVWQQFDLKLKEYDANGKSDRVFPIPTGTKVHIEYTKLNGNLINDDDPNKIIKGYSVNEVSKLNLEPFNIKTAMGSNTGAVSITMEFDVTLSEDGLKKLPKRSSNESNKSQAGVTVRGQSRLSYEKTGLANATAIADEDGIHYWSSKNTSASLNYDADEYDDGLSTGYNSRLGINALEDAGARIFSTGLYDMSMLDNVASADGIHYTLQLSRKISDTVYETVDMREYISDVTIQGISKNFSKGKNITTVGNMYYNENSQCIELYMDWDGKKNAEIPFWNVPVDFMVETGWKGDATQWYSNYKMELTVEIGKFNADKSALELISNSHAGDYIIYTNAKIYTGILPVYNTSGEN